MAKFTGKDMTLTLDGVSITCLQSVDISESADIQEIECAGASAKEKVTGLTSVTMSVTGALEQDDTTLIDATDPGDAGAVVFYPAGSTATYIKVDSTNGTVSDRGINVAVNGFGTYTLTLQLDDIAYTATPA